MPKLLITGFGPFAKHTQNASWESVTRAQPTLPPDWTIEKLQVPVLWGNAPKLVKDALSDDVRAIVVFGQAGDPEIRLERIAVNASTRHIEDIEGMRFDAEHIEPDGPPAYYTGLPYQRLLATLQRDAIPSRISLHAGGYLCNFTFYHLMHHVHHRRAGLVAGFVHVPDLERMGLEVLTQGVEIIAREVSEYADTRIRAYSAVMPR